MKRNLALLILALCMSCTKKDPVISPTAPTSFAITHVDTVRVVDYDFTVFVKGTSGSPVDSITVYRTNANGTYKWGNVHIKNGAWADTLGYSGAGGLKATYTQYPSKVKLTVGQHN